MLLLELRWLRSKRAPSSLETQEEAKVRTHVAQCSWRWSSRANVAASSAVLLTLMSLKLNKTAVAPSQAACVVEVLEAADERMSLNCRRRNICCSSWSWKQTAEKLRCYWVARLTLKLKTAAADARSADVVSEVELTLLLRLHAALSLMPCNETVAEERLR